MKLIYASVQVEDNISVLSQNFTAIHKTKSSEPMKKKVRCLALSKISEQTVDSNSDE